MEIRTKFEIDTETWGLGIGFVRGDIVRFVSIVILCFCFGFEWEAKR